MSYPLHCFRFLPVLCYSRKIGQKHSTGIGSRHLYAMTFDATSELAAIRGRRRALRKPRYRPSKLDRHHADLVALRQAGASYRELAE